MTPAASASCPSFCLQRRVFASVWCAVRKKSSAGKKRSAGAGEPRCVGRWGQAGTLLGQCGQMRAGCGACGRVWPQSHSRETWHLLWAVVRREVVLASWGIAGRDCAVGDSRRTPVACPDLTDPSTGPARPGTEVGTEPWPQNACLPWSTGRFSSGRRAWSQGAPTPAPRAAGPSLPKV